MTDDDDVALEPNGERLTLHDPTTGLPCSVTAGSLGRVQLYAQPDGSVVWRAAK